MEANSQLPTLDSFITSTNNPPTTNENLSFKVDMCQIIFYDFAINKEIGEYLQRVKVKLYLKHQIYGEKYG